MDAEATTAERVRAYVWPRLRIVGGAFAVGAACSVGLLLVLVGGGGWAPVPAARFAFALGTLAFGLGLLGWSGSAMAGRGFEAMQEHLDTNTDWTEADSRRAMARIGAFGAGAMLATGVAEAIALGA
ncbi:hypothetical protein G9C85_08030 [Halorubellus sp. JP-L1]|uniref:DUF7268 family protein n=1 Tax=Halorubellus sp. JP-L1 TaxID=2715753 RepID=UPI001409CA7D|nr:hypothetical protein [Halorubellus sp. JP-L1]NHN41584.1 hypothetical protein [Halorubellus sp. JP-L1]